MGALILPTLTRVPAASIASYAFASGTLTINLIGGGSVTYTDSPNNAYNQNAILKAMDQGIISSSAQVKIPAGPIVISSITSSVGTTFPLTSGQLTITGSGFYSGDAGKIWIEDVSGGPDSNSTSYTPSITSTTSMTATWSSAGDGGTTGTLPGNLLIYYKSNSGLQSNIIPAFIDSTGTFVTILPN